jgi:hypothetical protein
VLDGGVTSMKQKKVGMNRHTISTRFKVHQVLDGGVTSMKQKSWNEHPTCFNFHQVEMLPST